MASTDLCYSDNTSNNDIPYYSNEETSESSRRVSLSLSNASLLTGGVGRRSYHPLKKWSKSDPVLHCQMLQGDQIFSKQSLHNESLQVYLPESQYLAPAEIAYCLSPQSTYIRAVCALPNLFSPNTLALLLFRLSHTETGSVAVDAGLGRREHTGFLSVFVHWHLKPSKGNCSCEQFKAELAWVFDGSL